MKLVIFDLDGTLVMPNSLPDEGLFSGAKEMLLELALKKDIFLAVATGKSLGGTKKVLAKHNILDIFTSLQTPDNALSKPNPQMIENAISLAGVNRLNVIMVGDTYLDMNMAKAAKVRAIGVSWGYQTKEQLVQAGAEIVVSDFDELLQEIGE